MENKPLVSVVTMTRNRGNMIGRCISSVLSQTYTNIEHIVVDGASEDNTDEVVASFKDGRLIFEKLEYNWPLQDTWNHAVNKCKGKYITFLDSDDEYCPTKIEKQVQLIESLSEDYGFVYCWMTYYDSSDNNKIIKVHNTQLRGAVGDEVVGEPTISGTPTLLFRTDFYRNSVLGKPSLEEVGIASDWAMCARACQLTKVDFVPESLVKVYVNHGSIRQSETTRYYDDACRKQIQFHNYFLKTYANIFKRRPKSAAYHYYGIALCYLHMKEFCQFLKNMFKAFWYNPSFTIKRLAKC